ncbi:hypothetical protein C474_17334 [Halogeometricum pallidum JCM 14848]|uniref:Uncharacterized protein n=1 Tax=Halogeometricum pallidum JCM 14848 TaxID=1227487 RepID=M0CWX8_HALPD|nr:hypothetical protein [Halogeometricum pallidum]ELZ27133.1 hypothetical protein C474_17334 [Halogeometricum pallidum JCM 14848]
MAETEVDLVDEILETATERGEFLVTTELVTLIERHDPAVIESNEFGVSEDRLISYVEALRSGAELLSVEDVKDALAEETVHSDTWVGEEKLYVTGENHVSVYPRDWHEALAGEDDVVRFVEYIVAAVDDSQEAFPGGGQGAGIPEETLINVVTTLGPLTWEEAKREIERLRDEDVFSEKADQHPEARVALDGVDHN